MVIGLPFNLPKLTRHSSKLTSKIAFGVILLTFLFNYQPSFSFPPIKQNVARAQTPSPTPEQSQTIDAKSLGLVFKLPHDGYISTYFSSYHPGVDLATALGTPIHPVAGGTVVDAGFNYWGLGLNVVVDHGHGYQSLYAHMGKIYVKIGQKVSSDDVLGEVGLTGHTTGPHTHLQISKDGENINPLTVLPEVRNTPLASDFTPIATDSAQLSTITPPVETPIASTEAILVSSPTQTPTPTPTPTPDPSQTLNDTLKVVQVTNIETPSTKPSPTESPLQLLNKLSQATTNHTDTVITPLTAQGDSNSNLKFIEKINNFNQPTRPLKSSPHPLISLTAPFPY